MAANDQKSEELYVLTAKVQDVPEGYYPVGTQDALSAIAKTAPASDEGYRLYKLTTLPERELKFGDKGFLKRRYEQLAEGKVRITFAPDAIAQTVDDVTTPAAKSAKSVKDIVMGAVKEGRKPNAMDMLPIATEGLQAVASARNALNQAVESADALLNYGANGPVFQNRQGLFVHQDWLSEAGHAEFVMKVKPVGGSETVALSAKP